MSAVLGPTSAPLPLTAPRAIEGALPSQSEPLHGEAGGIPFMEQLAGAVAAQNAHAHQAQQAAEAFASGALDDIHGTMIAIKQADIELRVVANVRNKLLDAFNDLWRMNV